MGGKKTIAGESEGPRRTTLGRKRKEREAATAVTSYGTSSSLQAGNMAYKVATEGKARRNYGRLSKCSGLSCTLVAHKEVLAG